MRLVLLLSLFCAGCSTLKLPEFERPDDNPHAIGARCGFYELDNDNKKKASGTLVDFPNKYPTKSSDLACIYQVVAERHEKLLTKRQRSVNNLDRAVELTLYSLLIADGAAILSDAHISVLESITFGTAGLKVLTDYLNPSAKYDVFRVGANQSECVVEVGRIYRRYLEQWEDRDRQNQIASIRRAMIKPEDIRIVQASEFKEITSYGEYLALRSREESMDQLAQDLQAFIALAKSAEEAYNELPVAMASSISRIEDTVETGIRTNTGSATELFSKLRADAEKLIAARENGDKADQAADAIESETNKGVVDTLLNAAAVQDNRLLVAERIREFAELAEKLVEGVTKANQCAPGTT